MNNFEKHIDVRWSDLDPNFHVMHSRYYEFGAYSRMCFFIEQGVTPEVMKAHNVGPVLFREECIFKREIAFGDDVKINFFLTKNPEDHSRWSITHEIWKNETTLAAIINVDGAWIDTVKRKLAIPPSQIIHVFDHAPKSPSYEVVKK